jgi:hypothetical protein
MQSQKKYLILLIRELIMISIKENDKGYHNVVVWLKEKDAVGNAGIDLFLNDFEFVKNGLGADIGLAWHGNEVKHVPKKKCILMKSEPPIYYIFWGRNLYKHSFMKQYGAVMADYKIDDFPVVEYKIPKDEWKYVSEYFDKPKQKLLCMVLRNKKYTYYLNSMYPGLKKFNKYSLLKYRVDMDKAFCDELGDKYDSYGRGWDKRCFRGELGIDKEPCKTISDYQFTFCPENSRFNGYITEKPIQAMCCGSIPIYLGAPNVDKYLPKYSFINGDEFTSTKDIVDYIVNMDENLYKRYLDEMRKFVTTNASKEFSSVTFAKKLLKTIGGIL